MICEFAEIQFGACGQQLPAEQFGLVETTLPPSAPVQWHGNQQINRGLNFRPLPPKRGQQRGHAPFATILPLVNEVGEILTIQPRRYNAMKRRRYQQAAAAKSARV
ncbi:MAG: hypothetical protein ACKVHM_00945 [Pseudomonadales bacterium]